MHNNESIRTAIDLASPGTTINVDAGTYKEDLSITKNGIRLIGHDSHLVPPNSFSPNPCVTTLSDKPGVCIVGQLDGSGNIIGTVNNVTIQGFDIRKFPNEGVLAYGAKNFTATGNEFANNGGYGIFSLQSIKVSYIGNDSHGNGDAGLYIGESPHADATAGNTSNDNNGEGILFRDSRGGGDLEQPLPRHRDPRARHGRARPWRQCRDQQQHHDPGPAVGRALAEPVVRTNAVSAVPRRQPGVRLRDCRHADARRLRPLREPCVRRRR